MKNNYLIIGDTTIINIEKKNGTMIKMLIDTEDLRLLDHYNAIGIGYYRGVESYYAKINIYKGWNEDKGRYDYKTLMVHRLIAKVKGNKRVDHINHNTLDNRKSNLRITNQSDNLKHRSGKNSNNKSGYRNVSFIQNKWVVQLQVNGKNTMLGRFDDVDEAGKYAEKMREKYYKEFKGIN